MRAPRLCSWRHVAADHLRCAGRGYLRYAWHDRDGEAFLRARGVWGDHAPVLRWVPRAAPEVARRGRPARRATNDSSRVDAPSITMQQPWHALDRAVDSTGAPRDVRRRASRDAPAADQVCRPGLAARHPTLPRVRTGAQKAADPRAGAARWLESTLPETCRRRHWRRGIRSAHRSIGW